MTEAAAACPTAPSVVAARYEILRGAALGQALPPEARGGLMLFLSRGMWGWARALSVPVICEGPAPAPSPAPLVPHERKAVVHVLAALAITAADRRAL